MLETTQSQGLDPHRTYCPICKGDAEELTVGEVIKYFGESTDKFIGYGHPGGVLSTVLLEHGVAYRTEPVGEAEMLPAGGPCPDCVAEIAQQRAEFAVEVKKGGLHWTCDECDMFGVIIADDSIGFSAGVRNNAGVPPPKQLGVKFTKCSQHESQGDNVEGWIN